MKNKKKISKLGLNKIVISNIQSQAVKGGGRSTNCYPTLQTGCNPTKLPSGNTCNQSDCYCL
ncbi:hypothetical protein D1816_15555 [Aquimarina sp. AD10]|uniref:Uncharacterized protein n=1 Tax=Aquimarina aggregata TaxID=1642818 RepID=A0A162CS14_9FLAO|nr:MULTISPECIES: hypothetical protein [Aquimarina]AXT61712.1 hypothetical protein D1816_15555 [Aquimarina sp. AD10]KZS41314.1 hypothetical protein AWE51_21655 [Aquimarina aggregata]RKN00939.1 hypothetical protein D7033_06210 [Aquimarina sp. AD10]